MARELTKKQKAFVAEYLNNLNATKAAIAAGYSAHTASQQGSRLLKNSKVAEAINEEFIPRHERLETAADRMLQELAAMAFYNPANLFEPDGSVKRVEDMDPVTGKAIVSLKITMLFKGTGDQRHAYGVRTKIRLADKRRSLNTLAKYCFPERSKIRTK
jgi:phage terminase small subunit